MTPVDAPALVLGRPTSEHLRIEFLARTHPKRSDYWDGNWVSVRVRLRVRGFDGRALGDIRADEIVQFRGEVASLGVALASEARLQTLEDWLSVRLTGDGLGHFELRGFLMDQPGIGNRLDFAIGTLDQTDLPRLVAELDRVVAEFPVVGNR